MCLFAPNQPSRSEPFTPTLKDFTSVTNGDHLRPLTLTCKLLLSPLPVQILSCQRMTFLLNMVQGMIGTMHVRETIQLLRLLSHFRQCPGCGSFNIHRHRGGSRLKRFAIRLALSLRQYSCLYCNSLYYGFLFSKRLPERENSGRWYSFELELRGGPSLRFCKGVAGISVMRRLKSSLARSRVRGGSALSRFLKTFDVTDGVLGHGASMLQILPSLTRPGRAGTVTV